MRAGLCATVLLAFGCRAAPSTRPDATPPTPTALARPMPACGTFPPEPDATRSLAYDCAGFGPPKPTSTRDPRLAALVGAGEILPSIAASHFGVRDYLAELARAVDAGEALVPSALGVEERIVAQSGALSVAAALVATNDDPGLRTRAIGLVRTLALPSSTLDALGAEAAPELDAWLGPRSAWCHEPLSGGPNFHRNVYESTRVFRAVRSGELRAIFGQLVALDTDGAPHLTPIVAHVEVARGHEGAARGCVVELDAAAAREGAALSLVARSVAELRPSHFIAKESGRCGGCHAPGRKMLGGTPFGELEGEAAAAALADERRSALEAARALAKRIADAEPRP